MKTAQAQPQWWAEAKAAFETETAFANQVVAGVGHALVVGSVTGRRGVGGIQRGAGDLKLAGAGTARQLLDGTAIEIACREVHGGEGAAATHPLIHQADVFEQLGPVDIGDQPHAGDYVTHADVGGALALLRVLHHLFDGGVLAAQLFFQPAQ